MQRTSNTKAKQVSRVGQSILNGVIGDYLNATNNPLQIEMGFYHRYQRLRLNKSLPEQLDMTLSNKVIIFVHGLTNLESIWNFSDPEALSGESTDINYGTMLQRDLGFTPLFLRYNSGLPIDVNGSNLSQQLEQLFSSYPIKIDELVLVGFSMGGLLMRHAQHDGCARNASWIKALSKCIYLGTPHDGAPLEKLGTLVESIVSNVPLEYVNVWADWISIRSHGIKDLRNGMRLSFEDERGDAACPSFYLNAKHYFIGSRVTEGLTGTLLGDGLVRLPSSIPSSAPADNQSCVFEGLSHLKLASSERVYEQILSWLKVPPNTSLTFYKPKGGMNQPEGKSSQNREPLILEGLLDLTLNTCKNVLDTTERMHRSIADIPFNILGKIPIVKTAAKPAELVHEEVLNTVYPSLNRARDWTKKTSKKIAPKKLSTP